MHCSLIAFSLSDAVARGEDATFTLRRMLPIGDMGVHFTPVVHTWLADIIIRQFTSWVAEPSTVTSLAEDSASAVMPTRARLPPPMLTGNFAPKTLVCAYFNEKYYGTCLERYLNPPAQPTAVARSLLLRGAQTADSSR